MGCHSSVGRASIPRPTPATSRATVPGSTSWPSPTTAEALLPDRWQASLESLRQCEAAGEGSGDLVPFAGFEWTQTSLRPEDHYGHKNVIYPSLEAGALPPCAPSPPWPTTRSTAPGDSGWCAGWRRWPAWPRPTTPTSSGGCASSGAPPTASPACTRRTCRSTARRTPPRPPTSFASSTSAGSPLWSSPTALAWGIHAPPGASLANQLDPEQHDPTRQRLLEVYSGHGSGEVFDPAAARAEAAAREGRCAEPSADFLPCCWQAGVLVRARCPDPSSAACETRVAEAQQHALRAGRRPLRVLPDARFEEWLDCDESRGAFKSVMRPPPLRERPGRPRPVAPRTRGAARSASASGSSRRATSTPPGVAAATSRSVVAA